MYVYFTYYQLQDTKFLLLKVILEGEGPTGKSK
jgi:hypothetical protein